MVSRRELRPQLGFEPFRLDLDNACLWRGSEPVPLKPKAFAVLQCLVEHAGLLLTKDMLLRSVWPDAAVSDAVLKVCISEIRRALDDTTATPRFIVTAHRRGYRFVAPVTPVAPPRPSGEGLRGSRPPMPTAPLVGREAMLARLHRALAAALRRERQVVFVSGEAGIGKTAAVDSFLARAAADTDLAIVHGQGVELYGSAEPYLPVLDALGRLCREPGGEHLTALLRRHAPSWLVQLPGLVRLTDREAVPPEFLGATRDRMLREMADLVEAWTTEIPLVLVLEDLHWSDGATVDLVSVLARRRGPARLLVIGTFRPVDLIVEGHPLRRLTQELSRRGCCDEVALEPLDPARVAEYLAARLPGSVPAELAQIVHERTDGNPLFTVSVVDHLIERGWLVERDGRWALAGSARDIALEVPEGIRGMIEGQLEQLSVDDLRVLEAGSVVGVEFPAAAVAAALQEDPVAVEERCDGLVRQQRFLRGAGASAWPDGTRTVRYKFVHSLYQGVVYHQLAPGARRRLHQRIGERIEAAHAGQGGEVAAELIGHFEQAGDVERTVRYLRQAADNALRRYAGREAIGYLARGLDRVWNLRDTAERARLELDFQTMLGSVFVATKGHAAPEVERAYGRARTLCRELGETTHLFPVLCGLGLFHLQRANLRTAYELGTELLDLSKGSEDPLRLVLAHRALGTPLLWLGELGRARGHLEAAIAAYRDHAHRPRATVHGEDPAVTCLCYLARVLWTQGYPDQAIARIEEALTLAGNLGDPFSLAYAQCGAAIVYHLRREPAPARRWAQAAARIASERGYPFVLTWANILGGAALTAEGQPEDGMRRLTHGLTAHRSTGGELGRPYYLTLLAEAHQRHGQPAEGLRALAEAEATAQRDGERAGEAERHRLRGDLLLLLHGVGEVEAPPRPPGTGRASAVGVDEALVEAEACFRRALETADRQGAASLALRATISLSRLWQRQGRQAEAHRVLTASYASFSEGFDTVDLRDASALLGELAARPHPGARKAPRPTR